MSKEIVSVDEKALSKNIAEFIESANSVVISDDDGYRCAGEVLKKVKTLQKNVTAFWEPLRVTAKQTYDSVIKSKKDMLEPLEKVEARLKEKMADYTEFVESQAKERELSSNCVASEEIVNMEKLADELEAGGNKAAAEAIRANIDVIKNSMVDFEQHSCIVTPKADGISMRKSYEIVSVDEKSVPVEINGVTIRPVDESAVMKLIKESNGTISIQGIEYREKKNVSVRTA